MSRASPDAYRTIQDVLEALEAFQPRCLRPGQDRDEALFYAGKVELAAKIRSIIEREE